MKHYKQFIFLLIATLALSIATNAQINNTVLAQIGEQQITIQDLDSQVREKIERLPLEISELRQRELSKVVNELLLAAEAQTRKSTVDALLETEVRRRIQNPSEEQVQAVYEANRDRLGETPVDKARQQIIRYLRREQEEKLTADFAEKLKQRYKVIIGSNVNNGNLKTTDVVATVGGRTILARDFNERLKPLEYDLQFNVYQLQRYTIEQQTYSNLILAEARTSGLPPEEIIRREITDKLRENTPEEQARLTQQLYEKLQRKHNAKILINEPEPPVLQISIDDDPGRGNASAPVTVVMFTDFQCPACARTHPVVTEVLKNYADKVRFIVRDFPLIDVHENAFQAANAANAANAQGKFFEYIELLYQNQNSLDKTSLKKFAAQLGLNQKQFDTDLAGAKFAAEIQKDRQEGQLYGIKGTPAIFVNGVRLNELTAEAFKSAIEKALSRTVK